MRTAAAAVIDLEEFRRRRQQEQAETQETAPQGVMSQATSQHAPMVWCPVVVWAPVWYFG